MQNQAYYQTPPGFPGRGAGPGGYPFPGQPPYSAYPAHSAHPAYFPPPGPFRGGPPQRGPPVYAAPPHRGPSGPVYAAPPPALRNRAPPAPPPTPAPSLDPDEPVHYIYVKVDPAGERAADQVSRELTLRLLKYIHDKLAVIREMGVAIRVEKLTPELLANRSVFDALLAKGVTRLPALKTPENVYVGLDPIVGVYEENIRMYLAERRRGERPPATPDAIDEDPLEALYRDEMTLERAEKDRAFEGENGFEDGASEMMKSHSVMMELREKSSAGRRRLQSGGGPSPLEDGNVARRPAPPRRDEQPLSRPPPSRGDNVGGAARARPARDPSDDGDISDTIDRLAREIDSGTLSRAYSSQPGGDELEDDNAGDVRDSVMEAKYWANQQHTDDY